jgi:hypothetical protein
MTPGWHWYHQPSQTRVKVGIISPKEVRFDQVPVRPGYCMTAIEVGVFPAEYVATDVSVPVLASRLKT